MYRVIADTKAAAFDTEQNRKIRQISNNMKSDFSETSFLCSETDVPFSAYQKSIEFSDELSKRTFW